MSSSSSEVSENWSWLVWVVRTKVHPALAQKRLWDVGLTAVVKEAGRMRGPLLGLFGNGLRGKLETVTLSLQRTRDLSAHRKWANFVEGIALSCKHKCTNETIAKAILIALALLATPLLRAQQKAFAYEVKHWPLSIPQGSQVVVKIPSAAWQVENDQRSEFKLWLPFKNERGPDGLGTAYFVNMKQLLQRPDWKTAGFPFCEEFTLTKVYEIRSAMMHHLLPYTEVELRSGSVFLRLHFAYASSDTGSLNTELQNVLFIGTWSDFEQSEEFRKNVFSVEGNRIFTGQLSSLSDGMKTALMRMVCRGRNTISTENFKGKMYFAVSMDSDGTVYNSNKLGSSARAAKVINERVIPAVKVFEHPTQESGIDGLKFTVPIDHRNFADDSAVTSDDRLEVYLPLDAILKFLDSDLTSQQLLDNGIVRLNGDRIQVSLSLD